MGLIHNLGPGRPRYVCLVVHIYIQCTYGTRGHANYDHCEGVNFSLVLVDSHSHGPAWWPKWESDGGSNLGNGGLSQKGFQIELWVGS